MYTSEEVISSLVVALSSQAGFNSKANELVGRDPGDTPWTGVACNLGRVFALDLSNRSLHSSISSAGSLLDGLAAPATIHALMRVPAYAGTTHNRSQVPTAAAGWG